MLRAYHPKRVRAKTRIKRLQKGAGGGGFKKATPVKSVVRQMKTTSQVITANMALEGAMSEEEKLTSRTI